MERGELELLGRLWFPVARLEDVQLGPAPANLLGRELVVFQGAAGVAVADGWCPHRGMKLSMGAVVGGELECPYHGWRYESASGRCTMVPSLPGHLPPTRVCLKTYAVRVAYGLVWTCLGEPYLEPMRMPELDGQEWRPVADGDLPHQRVGEWSIALGEPRYVECGIRALSENFRDMSHFAFVHRRSMGPDVRREVDEYRVEKKGWTLRYTLNSGSGAPPRSREGQGGAGPESASPLMSQLAYGRTNLYTITLPASTYIFSSLPEGGRRFIAQFVAPASTDGERCRLFWMVGVDDETRERHGASVRDAFEFDSQIFLEDLAIVENCFPREQPLDPKAQVHSRADAYAIAYRRHYKQLLDEFNKQSSPLGGERRAGARNGRARR